MTYRKRVSRVKFLAAVAFIAFSSVSFDVGDAYAREAAFLKPGAGYAGGEAIKVDPKSDIDVGETVLNVAKRTSVFFVNLTNEPVKIEKIDVNGDANVTAEASANDCSKQGSIAPQSRCSVEVSATPKSPGAWSIDVLMTHDKAGRIARARLTGKTPGSGSSEGKSMGLAVSSKDIKPIDFGTVEVGNGKNVRSTLMINDSAETITIYSIDVIEADNGLQRLEQGCAVDMEIEPGSSCPVTLLWTPNNEGLISTDLIIRHSGKLGFAVIPIRGIAEGVSEGASAQSAGSAKSSSGSTNSNNGKKDIIPLPPSAHELEKAMEGRLAPISSSDLEVKSSSYSGCKLQLIGTVGDKALVYRADRQTEILSIGDTFDACGKEAKLSYVGSKFAEYQVDGQSKKMLLEAVSSLVSSAAETAKGTAPARRRDMPFEAEVGQK